MREEKIRQILKEDPHYPCESYNLVEEVFNFVQRRRPVPARRIPPQELSLGVVLYAVTHYGCLAGTVLKELKIESSSDVGNLVLNLSRIHVFRLDPGETLSDFDGHFRLDEIEGGIELDLSKYSIERKREKGTVEYRKEALRAKGTVEYHMKALGLTVTDECDEGEGDVR